ncbi:CGI-141 protein homolog, putative [Plasmodium relictum]|uniref:CGI-141 protein homolog, putative n=1 Tax=Plasmodium relictum TaxID=85471 RepID=A0A1J1H296_PLARL|nr:CGI-141 protein homolog, putative [Plasmodium relictum]CRG98987.1 CGI-141 protein homolog, putative [Plasmodium relictum]
MLDQNKTLGLLLFLLGIVFGFIGITFFFDKFFLCISNLLFLLGLYFLVGIRKILRFFMNKKKIAGSACFVIGLLLIVLSRTFIGFLFQAYGIYKLFFSFLPNIVNFIKYSPFSFLLELPGIKQMANYIENNKRLPI